MKRILLLLFILFIPIIALAQTPDEYKVKNEHVTFNNALSTLDAIESALKEFRNFTNVVLNDNTLVKLEAEGKAQINIKQNEINKFKNTDWSIQNIGFHNWILSTRAYILKSNYQIDKLNYEIAKCKSEVSFDHLNKLKIKLDHSKKEYESFLSRVSYAD